MMPVEVDIAWNMRVDNLDLDRPAAEQPRPPPPLSSMRQSIEATRSNPAVQAAMIDRPSQGQGHGQGSPLLSPLGHRSATGRRNAINESNGSTLALQSRQIREEMSRHAWWRAGQVRAHACGTPPPLHTGPHRATSQPSMLCLQVCYFCMGQRSAPQKRVGQPTSPRAASAASAASAAASSAAGSRAGSPTAEHDELTPLSHMHHRYVDCPKRRAAGEKEYTAEAISLALAAIDAERRARQRDLAVFAPLAELAAGAKQALAKVEGQMRLLDQLTAEPPELAPAPPEDTYLFYGPLYYKSYHAAFRQQHALLGKAIAQAVRLPHALGPAPTCWGQLKGIYASSARTEALRSHVTEHHVREQAREIATSLP